MQAKASWRSFQRRDREKEEEGVKGGAQPHDDKKTGGKRCASASVNRKIMRHTYVECAIDEP
jgi:hypothetical protein